MTRTKAMFFAFTGKELGQAHDILQVKDGYEVWNLKKLPLDEFIKIIKYKITPINDIVLRHYRIDENSGERTFGITEEQFNKVSWGLLIPDTLEEGGFSYDETLFLLNIYSPNFLNPIFYVNDMGIMLQNQNKPTQNYFPKQDGTIFNRQEFVSFYKLLFDQAKYRSWPLNRIQSWGKEDWRLFAATHLYSGLMDYENVKSTFGWQRESVEMATILETLFTAGDAQNEEVGYRLRKRIAVLLSWKYPSIEDEIKDLYKSRSDFVHGSIFQKIAKERPKAFNNLPIPNFKNLYKHKEYVRMALVAYLNLARIINTGAFVGVKSVIEGLEKAIIDIDLRGKLIAETKKIIDLLPDSKV